MPKGKVRFFPEKADQILKVVAAGNPPGVAAWYVEVHPSTVSKWYKHGRRLWKQREDGVELDEEETRIADFYVGLESARAQGKVRHVVNITGVATGTPGSRRETTRTLPDGTREVVVEYIDARPPVWQASAWFLERTDFKTWGRKTRTELTGEDGKPLLPLAAVRELLKDDDATDAQTP